MTMHTERESLEDFLVNADTAAGASATRHAWVKRGLHQLDIYRKYALVLLTLGKDAAGLGGHKTPEKKINKFPLSLEPC